MGRKWGGQENIFDANAPPFLPVVLPLDVIPVILLSLSVLAIMLHMLAAVNREISLYVQLRILVDVGHVFTVKMNSYFKIEYTFETLN